MRITLGLGEGLRVYARLNSKVGNFEGEKRLKSKTKLTLNIQEKFSANNHVSAKKIPPKGGEEKKNS